MRRSGRWLRAGAAAIALLGACAAPARAETATFTAGWLTLGGGWRTPYYIRTAATPGPVVVITGGVHGDEPAGAGAADTIRHWEITKGTLVVIPEAAPQALAAGTRTIPGEGDLNRNFPGQGDAINDTTGPTAAAIWSFVREHNPDWLLDMHEGYDYRASNPASVGSSIIHMNDRVTNAFVDRMIAAVNADITDPGKLFVSLGQSGPVDTSLARASVTYLGTRGMILETTSQGQPLSLRVDQHRTMASQFLQDQQMITGPFGGDRGPLLDDFTFDEPPGMTLPNVGNSLPGGGSWGGSPLGSQVNDGRFRIQRNAGGTASTTTGQLGGGTVRVRRAAEPNNTPTDITEGFATMIVSGWDFVSNDNTPQDGNGHGTHVAGTIGAVGNDGRGIAGVNWQVSILPLKFLSDSGSGSTSAAIAAINYATDLRNRGVNIVATNNSWGGGGYSTALRDAIRRHGEAGILFVAAAGNDAANNDVTPSYPANYDLPNVISVAALDRSDRLASFSNYGSTTVHIGAPGVAIYSTTPGNRYASYNGTSMAAPHVAGVAGLLAAANPQATVAEIRSAILDRGSAQCRCRARADRPGGRADGRVGESGRSGRASSGEHSGGLQPGDRRRLAGGRQLRTRRGGLRWRAWHIRRRRRRYRRHRYRPVAGRHRHAHARHRLGRRHLSTAAQGNRQQPAAERGRRGVAGRDGRRSHLHGPSDPAAAAGAARAQRHDRHRYRGVGWRRHRGRLLWRRRRRRERRTRCRSLLGGARGG